MSLQLTNEPRRLWMLLFPSSSVLPVEFSLCRSVCSKSLTNSQLKQPLTIVLWSIIHRHSNGQNYNVTTTRPFKPFHGRHTSVRPISQQSSFLSNPKFEDSCRKESYRNSSTAKCLRDLTNQSLLNCYWMHGTRLRTMDARWLSRASVGVRLDTSASDSRFLALKWVHLLAETAWSQLLFMFI